MNMDGFIREPKTTEYIVYIIKTRLSSLGNKGYKNSTFIKNNIDNLVEYSYSNHSEEERKEFYEYLKNFERLLFEHEQLYEKTRPFNNNLDFYSDLVNIYDKLVITIDKLINLNKFNSVDNYPELVEEEKETEFIPIVTLDSEPKNTDSKTDEKMNVWNRSVYQPSETDEWWSGLPKNDNRPSSIYSSSFNSVNKFVKPRFSDFDDAWGPSKTKFQAKSTESSKNTRANCLSCPAPSTNHICTSLKEYNDEMNKTNGFHIINNKDLDTSDQDK